MTASPHLGLGYLAPSQAQKHVTVNEAFRRLDALVQLGVLDRTLTAPPGGPAEGDRHIVGPAATGAWAGHDGEIAAFLDGVWVFVAPKPGWLAYVAAEGALLVFLPGGWVSALGSLASLDALAHLGVNATADLVNRFAVASQAVLFNHDGAGVQVKLNKAGVGDTASVLFQRGFSGRAEFGIAGSDAFALKVSADGAAWATALAVDPATGAVDLPQTPRVKVDKFVASGVWTKPAWAKRVRVMLCSGGGGGGSGGLRGASVAIAGGGGAAPGTMCDAEFAAADLPATVAVTVGAGGAGGAAVTTADTNGAAGAQGGASAFGGYLQTSVFGNQGGGGAVAGGAAGLSSGARFLPPCADVSGGAATTLAGASGSSGPGRYAAGAGGGGGLTAANAEGAGGASGFPRVGTGLGGTTAGGAGPGGAGAAGAAIVELGITLIGGNSGGGGAAGHAVAGGAGGAGSAPGGAGGGGGAGRNGLSSGKGGNGARGEAWVVSMA
ncbi:DUF2793 domain-containing protein [Hansschlegelia sp. KR7-227]|uniref:DUF2793 domain-containing protein n=1 Tax=Hansschlegelia sp. KR7-227 TaxID=3400914 RepID=UPI003C07CD92